MKLAARLVGKVRFVALPFFTIGAGTLALASCGDGSSTAGPRPMGDGEAQALADAEMMLEQRPEGSPNNAPNSNGLSELEGDRPAAGD